MHIPWRLLLVLRNACALLNLPYPDEERVFFKVRDRLHYVGDAATLAILQTCYPVQWWTSEGAHEYYISAILTVLLTNGNVKAYESLVGRFSIDAKTTETAHNEALYNAFGHSSPRRRLAFFTMCTVADPTRWLTALWLRKQDIFDSCAEEIQALAVATSRGRVLDPLAAIESHYLCHPCLCENEDAPAAREWYSKRFGVIVEDIMCAKSQTWISSSTKSQLGLFRAWEAAPTFPQDLPTDDTCVRINGGDLVDTAAPQEEWAYGEETISRVDGTASAIIKLLDATRSGDTLCSVRLSAAPTADELLCIALLAPRLAELNAQDVSDAVLRGAALRLMRDPGLRALYLRKSDVTGATLALYAGLHKIVLDGCINDVTEGIGALFGPLQHVELVRTPCRFCLLTKTMTDLARETLRVVRVVGTNPEDGHAALRLLGHSSIMGGVSRSVSVENTPFVKGFDNAAIHCASGLVKISLRGCTTLDASGFYQFAKATHSIHALDVSYTSLCDVGLYALQSQQHHQVLNIGHTRVTEDGLRHLGRRRDIQFREPCPVLSRLWGQFSSRPQNLRMLTLDGLPGVTEDVVQGILETHRGLLYLSVRDCVNFAARTAPELVGKLCKGHPLLLLRC